MSPQLPGLADLTEVGRGAYGVVYRARQERLSRFVAVKVLAARLGGEAAARFAQECAALGALSGHPNIVAVHETGKTPEGEPYLVMPFCERGSLADRIPLPWPETVDVGVRLAGALQTAHDAGILHRDLKPANVLVDVYGNAQLADFGQARHSDSNLTGTGAAVLGTPAYSAPEILSGSPASPASDVYSLAATLVTLVSGHGPHSRRAGENIAAVMFRVLNEPPVDLRPSGVPDGVCEVLEWALDRDPARRPPSAAVFGKALQGLQRKLGLEPSPLTVAGEDQTSGSVPGTPHSAPPPGPHSGPHNGPGGGPAPGRGATPPPGPYPGPASGPYRGQTPGPPRGPYGGPASGPVPPQQAPFQQTGPSGPAPFQQTGPAGPASYPNLTHQPTTGRHRAPWLVAGAVVVVAAIAATLFLVLRDTGDDGKTSARDPNDLLLTAADYGMANLRPLQGLQTIFTQLVGQPGPHPQGTNLARCLELPVSGIEDWRSSATYAQGTPLSVSTGPPDKFAAAESAGLAMDNAADAEAMVTSWTDVKLDSCQVSLIQAGVSLVGTKAEPDISGLTVEPLPEPDTDVTYRGLRVSLPLNAHGSASQMGKLYIDLEIMARDDSVLIAVVQHFPNASPPDVHTTTVAAMVDKLSS